MKPLICRWSQCLPAVAAMLTALPSSLRAQAPEIADPNLTVVATVRADPVRGAVVAFNPRLCRQLGAACGFLKAHAQGHIYYGHPPAQPGEYSERSETLADCFAARHGDPMDILAAHQLFTAGRDNEQWGLHGDTTARAKNVRNCASQEGKWLGN